MQNRHVLVPLDGSTLAESALPVARELAHAMDADLTLFAAMPGVYGPAATREPLAYLADVAAAQLALGADTHVAFRMGDPATHMLEFLADGDIDLIVMATHGRSGPARTVFGSVADQVVQASPVPVVLLHPGQRAATRLRTLLVPEHGDAVGTRGARGTRTGMQRATRGRHCGRGKRRRRRPDRDEHACPSWGAPLRVGQRCR